MSDQQNGTAPGAADETRADTAVIAAVPDERPAHVSCGGCGEQFARAAFGGRALFLAETLRDAALTAGWEQDGDAWTCTVCLARANAEPQPEPVPAVHEPAPDTDPIDQSVTILADYDGRVYEFWEAADRSNHAADLKIRTRLDDAYAIIGELPGSAA